MRVLFTTRCGLCVLVWWEAVLLISWMLARLALMRLANAWNDVSTVILAAVKLHCARQSKKTAPSRY